MKHPYIYAWGLWNESRLGYVNDQAKYAEESNAPEDAIYQKSDGTWATVAVIKSAELRDGIQYLATGFKSGSLNPRREFRYGWQKR